VGRLRDNAAAGAGMLYKWVTARPAATIRKRMTVVLRLRPGMSRAGSHPASRVVPDKASQELMKSQDRR